MQAFIVFEETSSATAALRALQGFNFLGREVVRAHVLISRSFNPFHLRQKLEFARSKSFATAKRDGTFKPMQKEAEKRKAAAAAGVWTSPAVLKWLASAIW